jgi:tetratricopeptide (TPR) repeat protein
MKVMWSFIARFGVLLLLASLAQPLPHARAQQVQRSAPAKQDKAAELSRLIERWQKTDDPEVAIAALEAALRLEPQIRQWPLQASREQVRGRLLNGLGESYWRRRQGSRADNLEAAIKAYEAALTVWTREALPQDWAATQNNLAAAYSDRIKGSKADNLEAAIKAYEAALTVRTREALPRDWADTQYNLANAYSYRIRGDRADNL